VPKSPNEKRPLNTRITPRAFKVLHAAKLIFQADIGEIVSQALELYEEKHQVMAQARRAFLDD
jgi:hypothetical protein